MESMKKFVASLVVGLVIAAAPAAAQAFSVWSISGAWASSDVAGNVVSYPTGASFSSTAVLGAGNGNYINFSTRQATVSTGFAFPTVGMVASDIPGYPAFPSILSCSLPLGQTCDDGAQGDNNVITVYSSDSVLTPVSKIVLAFQGSLEALPVGAVVPLTTSSTRRSQMNCEGQGCSDTLTIKYGFAQRIQ